MLRVARALRQHGVVRARCEEFDPAELAGTVEESMEDPDTKEKVILTAADPFAGLHKLMAALEATVGKSSLDRKGELRRGMQAKESVLFAPAFAHWLRI